MKVNLDEILNEIMDDNLAARVSSTVGGYERFQAVGNALENYYLEDSIYELIKKLAINMQLRAMRNRNFVSDIFV